MEQHFYHWRPQKKENCDFSVFDKVVVLLLLFLTFSVLVANPKKLLYTVANPARGLLNREKRTKEKVWLMNCPYSYGSNYLILFNCTNGLT